MSWALPCAASAAAIERSSLAAARTGAGPSEAGSEAPDAGGDASAGAPASRAVGWLIISPAPKAMSPAVAYLTSTLIRGPPPPQETDVSRGADPFASPDQRAIVFADAAARPRRA